MESVVNSRRVESSFTALARLEELDNVREKEEAEKNELNKSKNDGETEKEGSTSAGSDRMTREEGGDDEASWTKASPGKSKSKLNELTVLKRIDTNEQSNNKETAVTATVAATAATATTKETNESAGTKKICTQVETSIASFQLHRNRLGKKSENEQENMVSEQNDQFGHSELVKLTCNDEIETVTEIPIITAVSESTTDSAMLLKAVEDGKERARQDTEKEDQARAERRKQLDRINKERMARTTARAAQQAAKVAEAVVNKQVRSQKWKEAMRSKQRKPGEHAPLEIEKEIEEILVESERESGLEVLARTMTRENRLAAHEARRIAAKAMIMAGGRQVELKEGTRQGGTESMQVSEDQATRQMKTGKYQGEGAITHEFIYERILLSTEEEEPTEMPEVEQDPTSDDASQVKVKNCVQFSSPMRKPSQNFILAQEDKTEKIIQQIEPTQMLIPQQLGGITQDGPNQVIEMTQEAIEPRTGGQQHAVLGIRHSTLVRMEVIRKKTEPPISYSAVISGTAAQVWRADGGAFFRSTRNNLLTIRKQSEMPKDEQTGHEFFEIIEKPMGNEVKTTIMFHIESKYKLNELKQDGRLFHYVRSNGIYLFQHIHKTISITAIGWLAEREVALTDTDQVAEDIADALAKYKVKKARAEGKTINIATARSQIPTLEVAKTRVVYKPKGKAHIYIDALELKCEYSTTEQVRSLLFEATNAGAMPKRKLGFFVPYRAKADPVLYQATVKRHLQFLDEATACVIRGLHDSVLQTMIPSIKGDKEVQMEEYLLTATYGSQTETGQVVRRYTIRAIERTRKTETEGKYRITFTKEASAAAHDLIDTVLCGLGTASDAHKKLALQGDPYKDGVRRGKGRLDQTAESSLLLMDNLTSERQQMLDKNFRVRDNSMIPTDYGPHEYEPDETQATIPNPWFNDERRKLLLNLSDDSSDIQPKTAARYITNTDNNNQSMMSTLDTSIVGSIQSELSQCKLDVAYLRTAMENLLDENKSLKATESAKEQDRIQERKEAERSSLRKEQQLTDEIKKLERVNQEQQQEYSASLNAIVTKLNRLEMDKDSRNKEVENNSSKLDQLLLLMSAQQNEAATRQRTRRTRLPRVSVLTTHKNDSSIEFESPQKTPPKFPTRSNERPKRSKVTNQQPSQQTNSPYTLDTFPESPMNTNVDIDTQLDMDQGSPIAEFSPTVSPSGQTKTTQRNLSDIMTAVSSAAKSFIGMEPQPPPKLSSLSQAAADGKSKWKAESQALTPDDDKNKLPNSNCSASISNIDDASGDGYYDEDDDMTNDERKLRLQNKDTSFDSVSFDGEDDALVGTTLGTSHPTFRDISTIAPAPSDSEDRTGWSEKEEDSIEMEETDEAYDSEEDKKRLIIQSCTADYDEFYNMSGDLDAAECGSIDDDSSNSDELNKTIMAACYADMDLPNHDEATLAATRTGGPTELN